MQDVGTIIFDSPQPEAGLEACYTLHAARACCCFLTPYTHTHTHAQNPLNLTFFNLDHTDNLCRIGGYHGSKPKALIPGSELLVLLEAFQSSLLDKKAADDLLITYLKAEAVVLTA